MQTQCCSSYICHSHLNWDLEIVYLGKKLCKTRLHNGVCAQAISLDKYVQEAVRNFAVHLAAHYGGKYRMPKTAENLFEIGYDPELETSPELDPDAASYYLTIIGILRWMIKLGRTITLTAVPSLSSHAGLPREVHLDAAVHVMAHVGQRYNSRLMYDFSCSEINHSVFKKCDWSEF